MHLEIGHGHEERHRKESYVVFIPKKYSHFAAVEKNTEVDEQNGKSHCFEKLDFIFASGPKLLPN